jgi:hypothetical protein
MRTQRGVRTRVGPLLAVLGAGAVSEHDLRRLQHEQDAQRHAGRTRITRLLHERGALRAELTPQSGANLIVTLGSYATYQCLVITHGWTNQQYEAWLTDTL